MPTLFTSTWRPGVERTAEERGAAANRLARHLFQLATTAPPGKEVRVTRIGSRLQAERRAAWERWYGPVAAARTYSAVWHALGWAVFGLAYVGAVVFVSSVLKRPAGAVLLVLAAGSRLSAYIGATVGEIGFLRGIWLDGSIRLAWLEDYVASLAGHADAAVPDRLQQGISFENLSFAYPGTDRLVLDSVNLHFEPGSVVAIVGENGAGKSTLVKLLCRLYQPTSGRIMVDGVELSRMPPEVWRSRASGAFQDFFRFELKAHQTVGVGDLPRIDDRPAVAAAVDRAGATDVVEHLVAGLETQLGPTWPDGVELSFGQWQKLALARGFMRERPLLLVLDEPTAALDAESEHALFERYAAAAPRRRGMMAASPSSSRTGSAPCAWPTSSWCSTARVWSNRARTKCLWPKVVNMPSSTRSRPRRIVRDDRVTRTMLSSIRRWPIREILRGEFTDASVVICRCGDIGCPGNVGIKGGRS